MILSERHIDEDISNEYEHYSQDCEGQGLSVVMEVLRNIHVIESNECIEVLFFYLNVPQLPNFHHQLHFLLVSQGVIHQDVLDVLLLGVDLKVLVFIVGGCSVTRSFLLNHVLLSLHSLLILKLLLGTLNKIHSIGLLGLHIGRVGHF